jgi:6-phosphogluconolactonase
VLPDADAVAVRAAARLGERARAAVAERGVFTLALSGGSGPRRLFARLAVEDVPWEAAEIFQVDERVAPAGHEDRNLTQLLELLPPAARERLRPMPVEEKDLERGAADYAATLPEQLDAVQLGLGDDGHTASLVPGDPVLDVRDRDIAVTAEYRGRRRMTLTYPPLARARHILWLVTGADKAVVLARLQRGDATIPAGLVERSRAVVVADSAAAVELVR